MAAIVAGLCSECFFHHCLLLLLVLLPAVGYVGVCCDCCALFSDSLSLLSHCSFCVLLVELCSSSIRGCYFVMCDFQMKKPNDQIKQWTMDITTTNVIVVVVVMSYVLAAITIRNENTTAA